jgi:hypothetical protein
MASNTKNLRLLILEETISIEECISLLLGTLLAIDYENSISFGTRSTALSFNQKVQIIQDLKGIDKIMVIKLSCLMNIRNKFAHVSAIDSFENLFTLSRSGKEIKKNLDRWYNDVNNNKDVESRYLDYFNRLIKDIDEFIFELVGKHQFDLGYKKGELDFRTQFLNELLEEVSKIKGGKVLINRITDSVARKRLCTAKK